MNDGEKVNQKKKLKEKAIAIMNERISHAASAMSDAQRAANEEGKSSVGDKHETSRAMAQIDIDIYARQVESAQKELSHIMQTDVSLLFKSADTGAFIETDNGKFFFLTGLGAIDVNNEKIFYLSISSPFGKLFAGKKVGEKIDFNGKIFLIMAIY